MIETLSILILVAATYWRTFKFHLIVDDLNWRESYVKYGLTRGRILSTISARLYSGGTFCRKQKDGTYDASIPLDHVFQTALHAAICVLMYWAFGANTVSLCAALLYAVNPINNQTAIWLNGRRYAVNIIIMLVMMLMGPWGLLLYPATALFQVNAFFIPLLFGWYGVAAIPVFLLIAHKVIRDKIQKRKKNITNDDSLRFTPKRLIIVVKTYGLYMLKMLVPGRTLFIYPNNFYWGMTKDGNKHAYSFNLEFWGGILSLGISGAGLVMLWPHQELFWMWLVMILSVLQWCGFITVTQQLADRYASLANVFVMYFLSLGLHSVLGADALLVVAVIGTYYLCNLFVTMRMYRDIWAFYDYHLYFTPGNPKFREFKAARLISKNRDVMGAWEVVKRGLEILPNDMKMNMLGAHCMHLLNDRASTVMYLRRAWQNVYISQENVLRGFQKTIFGIDLEDEADRIANKTSQFSSKQRKEILNIHKAIYQEA